MDQLLGKQHTPRLGDSDRRRADVLAEQPPQLSAADAKPAGETFDVVVIEASGFDQGQCTRYGVGGAAPERKVWRNFRPTAQAGAKAGFLGRGRGSIE